MIRTLKIYLTKELLKATLLATIAFTLVMTIFAVIEPLYKEGVSPKQALKLFGYIAPVMFSMTLPIAALFGTTIVYGRFSRDNELMACRASGISTVSVLTPAIWLGVVVSLTTFILGFYVAPKLLGASERMIKDLRQIAYNKLMRQQYIKFKYSDIYLIFHADHVEPNSPWADGVIILDYSDPNNAKCLVASSAKLEFYKRSGKSIVEFYPTNPTVFQQNGENIGIAEQIPFRRGELPTIKNKPKFYDWYKLYQTLKHPESDPSIASKITRISREICSFRFYEEVARQINNHHKYTLTEIAEDKSTIPPATITIHANRTRIEKKGRICLLPAQPSSKPSSENTTSDWKRNKITITQMRNGKVECKIWASKASIKASWDRFRNTMVAAVLLEDVSILPTGESPENIRHQKKYILGPFAIPKNIISASKDITADTIEQLRTTAPPKIREAIRSLFTKNIPILKRKVWAEIHQRLSYSISCLLMVMLGAVLGIIFRGGEILTAFAISSLPSAAVIILILMGKQLMTNPKIPSMAYGATTIWAGIAALAAITIYLYAGPMRR